MTTLFRTAFAIGVLTAAVGIHGQALAAPVTISDSAVQTVDGQDFNFNFAGLPASDGTAGSLTIRIRGDFSIGASLGESYAFNLDGLLSVADLQATNANLITSFGFNDILFEEIFAINGATMSAIAANGVASLLVDYAVGVNVALSAAPSIMVTLNYQSAAVNAAPEPGSLALLVMGLVAAASARKRVARRASFLPDRTTEQGE